MHTTHAHSCLHASTITAHVCPHTETRTVAGVGLGGHATGVVVAMLVRKFIALRRARATLRRKRGFVGEMLVVTVERRSMLVRKSYGKNTESGGV